METENVEKKDISLLDKVNKLYQDKNEELRPRRRNLRLPAKAKVSRSRQKKRYCGVLFLNENSVISGERTQLDGGTYRTSDGNIHYTNGKELIFWEGKYPVLFQRYDKTNPTNLFTKKGETNEIYGQNKVKLRMESEVITDKKDKGKGGILKILLILVGGYFAIKMLFPGLLG